MREALTQDMFTVIVQGMGGTIMDVVGPFYSEQSATEWAQRNVGRASLAWTIRPLTERGIWEAKDRKERSNG